MNGYFSRIVEGCRILLEKGDQQKIKKVSDEMKRISKDGVIELGELLNSVNNVVKETSNPALQEKRTTEQQSSNQRPQSPNNSQTIRETSEY